MLQNLAESVNLKSSCGFAPRLRLYVSGVWPTPFIPTNSLGGSALWLLIVRLIALSFGAMASTSFEKKLWNIWPTLRKVEGCFVLHPFPYLCELNPWLVYKYPPKQGIGLPRSVRKNCPWESYAAGNSSLSTLANCFEWRQDRRGRVSQWALHLRSPRIPTFRSRFGQMQCHRFPRGKQKQLPAVPAEVTSTPSPPICYCINIHPNSSCPGAAAATLRN